MSTVITEVVTDGRTQERRTTDALYPTTIAERVVLQSKLDSEVDFADFAREVINVHNSRAERVRRERTYIRRQILDDNWRNVLAEDLAGRMSSESAARICGANGKFVDTSRNPARDMWRELAVLYKNAAKRETVPTADGKKYADLLEGTKFHTFWQTVEIALEAFNTVFIWPEVVRKGADGSRRVLRHRWAAGDTITATFTEQDSVDPFSILIADEWTDLEGAPRVTYHFFTEKWFGQFNEKGARVDPATGVVMEDEAGGWENPIGEFPFTVIQRIPHSADFWSQSAGEDLVQLTLKVGRQQTLTNDLWLVAGHKQLLVTGRSVKKLPMGLLDPAAILKILGEDISTQVVDWPVDFKERNEVIDSEEKRAAASRGINAERLNKTTYQSGEAAQLAERGLTEQREKKEEVFLEAEQSHMRKVALVAKAGLMKQVHDPDAKLEVTWARMDYTVDPISRVELSNKRVALGLDSLVDLVLEDHPSWSNARALKHVKDNIKLTAEIQAMKNAANVPKDLTNESKSAEDNGRLGPIVRDSSASTEETPTAVEPLAPGSSPDTTDDS